MVDQLIINKSTELLYPGMEAFDNYPGLRPVFQLAQICESEAVHSQHVTFLALRVFDQLQELHHLGIQERSWLCAAGLLHDIGWIEGWHSHHKTSLRIILETPMLPFRSKERLIVGSIARYHRKGLPKRSHDNFAALGKKEQSIVLKLAAFLRLANSLDVEHRSLVKDLNCVVTDGQITIYCVAEQPAEDELLVASERADLLSKVFHRKIYLQTAQPDTRSPVIG
jgi:exopolyphosphatase/pppGpp-phosphohydrolase